MNHVVDLVALSDVRDDLDGEVLRVLKHVHDDLLDGDRDRALQLAQELLLVVELTEGELEGVGVEDVEVLGLAQLLHDLLLLSDVLRTHLATAQVAAAAACHHSSCFIELERASVEGVGVEELGLPVGEV